MARTAAARQPILMQDVCVLPRAARACPLPQPVPHAGLRAVAERRRADLSPTDVLREHRPVLVVRQRADRRRRARRPTCAVARFLRLGANLAPAGGDC